MKIVINGDFGGFGYGVAEQYEDFVQKYEWMDLEAGRTAPELVAFVEVKTRHAIPGVRTKYGRPAQAVNASKRGHMVEAAKAYLREHPTELQPRIDVAEVYVKRLPDGSDEILAIQIYPNEFRGR